MIPPQPVLRSRDNPLLKRVLRLAEGGRHRVEEGVCVLAGWHLIRACIDAAAFGARSLERIVVCETVVDGEEGRSVFEAAPNVPVTVFAEEAFSRIGPVRGPNAVIALVRIPAKEVQTTPLPRAFELWLEDVQDPGNVGTLIRTAAAAGVTHVRLSSGCADPWSPKVLRAGMGGQFLVPIATDADLAHHAQTSGLETLALALGDARDFYEASLVRPLAVVLGNEGAGLTCGLQGLMRQRWCIPMPGGIESLNVATAGAIALFEVVRREREGSLPRASHPAPG